LSFSVDEDDLPTQATQQTNNKNLKFLSPNYKSEQNSQQTLNLFQKEIEKISTDATDIEFSVYFRDLNNGPWLSYNSINMFDGASLLKVPVMIAYLKAAETNPELLNMEVTYLDSFTEEAGYDPAFDQNLKIGNKYTIKQLIEIMIKKSDNTAKNILQLNAQKLNITPDIETTYEFLGLLKEDASNTNIISIEQYAGIFKILYNAEFLNGEMSNKALEIMSQTDYNNGLTKYKNPDLTISHKYGVRFFEGDQIHQVHDCGIIYKNNPYILCIMTNGKNKEKQENLIANIAKLSFELFK